MATSETGFFGDEDTIAATGTSGDARPDEPAPTRLGRYVLLHRLGAGGMGVVYAAYDEKLDRKVAIKLLRAQSRPEAQLRLVREAQALARLSHPNVVQIYEIAEVAGPGGVERAYLVMEFVDGVTLGAWLSERPRSRAEILEVFLAAGRGLAAAHAAGLVHRDFKPENVMLRGDGRVLVMDFGLASADAAALAVTDGGRDLETSGRLSAHLTATGAMMGTPAYMAPEQFLGLGTDAQTDQFGFCVALWEALYGARPFAGKDVHALALAVVSGKRAAPERDEVPGWLRAVLERGLAREPAERWPSMQALLDALGRDPTRRRRAVLASLGALALVLGALAGLLVGQQRARATIVAACQLEGRAIADDWNDAARQELAAVFHGSGAETADASWQSTRRRMDDYAAQWSELRARACLETRLLGSRADASYERVVACLEEQRATFVGLTEAWRAGPERQTIARAPAAAAGLVAPANCSDEAALARQIRPPEDARALVVALRARLGHAAALNLAGQYAPALAEARAALVEAEALGWRPLVAEARVRVGMAEDDIGELEAAAQTLRRAGLDAVASRHDMVALRTANALCGVHGFGLAQHEVGLMWCELAGTLTERLELVDTVHEAMVLSNLALVQRAAGAIEPAIDADRRALSIRLAALGPEHPEVAASLESLGDSLTILARYDEALEHLRRALAIYEAALGPDHIDVGYVLSGVGDVLVQKGLPDEALAAFQRALRILERALGPEHLDVAVPLNNIGVVLWRRGDHAAALAVYGRVQAIQSRVLGPEHPLVAATLDNIGNVLNSDGRHVEALAVHRRALALREAGLDPGHFDIAASLNNLGSVYFELGRYDEALTSFRRAESLWGSALGEHPNLATVRLNIANVLARRGAHEEALALFGRAQTGLEEALGPDHSLLAHALVGLGESHRELGRLELARPPLERAMAIRTRVEATAGELAEVRFALARLSWAEGRREQARDLASAARDGYRNAGRAAADELAAVEAWLADHGAAP